MNKASNLPMKRKVNLYLKSSKPFRLPSRAFRRVTFNCICRIELHCGSVLLGGVLEALVEKSRHSADGCSIGMIDPSKV